MTKLQTIAGASIKYSLIAAEIRHQIVTNALPPGSQLPTRTELGQHYQVSSVTVQRALDCLIQDGFVDATRRKGSFVVEYPPHLCRYAVVFEKQPTATGHTSRYWTAITNEALNAHHSRRRDVVVYYGIDTHGDSPDFQKLISDLRNHRLAGIVFPDPMPVLETSLLQPWLEEIGKVVVCTGSYERGWPAINLDAQTFIDRALDYLQARGRRSVALLSGQRPSEPFHQRMAEAMAARGMVRRPYWNQYASISDPETARNCAHLLMMPVLAGGMSERPDGLIIADDNLVEHASIGLIAAGVRVSSEIDVVAHCNFPWPVPSVIPVKRLGYDIRCLVETAIDLIDCQRRGEPMPALTYLNALFEEEVPYRQG